MDMRQDRRSVRTRTALIEAFNRLVLERRQRKIRVSDIVAQANVGRSTFYDHYSSADDIHMEALSRPLAHLADAAAGRGDPANLAHLLEHFWENRQRAREIFSSRTGEKVSRLLADMVEARLEARRLDMPARLAAIQLAEAALAPVRGWLMAEAPARPEALAASLCRTGEALAAALEGAERPEC